MIDYNDKIKLADKIKLMSNKTSSTNHSVSSSFEPLQSYTVPEIVINARIIKIVCDIIEGEVKIIKCSKS